eukprot:3917337-Karenia_brevis.AAC.1
MSPRLSPTERGQDAHPKTFCTSCRIATHKRNGASPHPRLQMAGERKPIRERATAVDYHRSLSHDSEGDHCHDTA